MRLRAGLALALLLALLPLSAPRADDGGRGEGITRIKDITKLKGARENQLVGYGLVIGLPNSGDSMRNSPFTEQSLRSMLDRMGVNVQRSTLRARNVAAVVVTAELPPFAGRGSRIDVTVSALGDARSLLGGTLVITPLVGADGEVYAVAQGPVAVTGFNAAGDAESLTRGVPTAGRVPNGALVERELPDNFGTLRSLVLELRNPDYRTAVRVADAINQHMTRRFGARGAYERDYRSILLVNPAGVNPVRFLAEVGDLVVQPDAPARVVIDERTGTVVIGKDVQVSTVAVTHGNLTVRITETPVASQPNMLSNGDTVVLPTTRVEAEEKPGQLAILNGSSLQTLVGGLNQIGLKPTGIIAILQAIKTAGALQADLVVQ
ncbi:flagellar basal body P-ring protein FlgI [Salinarimonas soli]|uniref:Flagellar P-ring protein n=1 Tax=Salinarimonas soli TaxID=1638099 RepID=A0A5B2V7C7_9HYPH|nr:flagellar basal body P-ring protein FlgI [Salinarimonas soli]KAA2234708.1 flagellar basal body P-ring protein FlgI [Salinarimonas soli]